MLRLDLDLGLSVILRASVFHFFFFFFCFGSFGVACLETQGGLLQCNAMQCITLHDSELRWCMIELIELIE